MCDTPISAINIGQLIYQLGCITPVLVILIMIYILIIVAVTRKSRMQVVCLLFSPLISLVNEILENGHKTNSPESKGTSSNCLFSLENKKLKEIGFTNIKTKTCRKKLTAEKLEPGHNLYFCMKKCLYLH